MKVNVVVVNAGCAVVGLEVVGCFVGLEVIGCSEGPEVLGCTVELVNVGCSVVGLAVVGSVEGDIEIEGAVLGVGSIDGKDVGAGITP